jgi:hypothetical protein
MLKLHVHPLLENFKADAASHGTAVEHPGSLVKIKIPGDTFAVKDKRPEGRGKRYRPAVKMQSKKIADGIGFKDVDYRLSRIDVQIRHGIDRYSGGLNQQFDRQIKDYFKQPGKQNAQPRYNRLI